MLWRPFRCLTLGLGEGTNPTFLGTKPTRQALLVGLSKLSSRLSESAPTPRELHVFSRSRCDVAALCPPLCLAVSLYTPSFAPLLSLSPCLPLALRPLQHRRLSEADNQQKSFSSSSSSNSTTVKFSFSRRPAPLFLREGRLILSSLLLFFAVADASSVSTLIARRALATRDPSLPTVGTVPFSLWIKSDWRL